MDRLGLDPFLNTHFRDWKLGHTSVASVGAGVRYHVNSDGGVIQTWRRVERLGSDSFGHVWKERGLDGRTLNHVRVVKQLRKDRPNFIQSSRRELYALTTFSKRTAPEHHKLFVQLLNWYEDRECLFLTMEYVRHGDLQRYIEIGTKFPDRQAPLITGQIASALQYMHTKGFVHRDLRPSNILVAAEGPAWSVKLADFGIATNVEDTWPSKDYIRTSGYMAPEMVDSPQYYTTAVDVWALGAVVFCLLVGIPHFHKLDDMLGYCAGIRQFPTSVLGASTELSIDFILNAMDPVPDKRMSIQKALNHKWLHVIEDASVVEHRCLRCLSQESLPKVNSPWQLSTASILHNNVEKPTKPLHSPLVAQIGGFPAMARDTCMVCHQRFQARNELFDHLEKKGHTVDPVSSLIVHFMRHGNCLQGVKKLKRQHRRSERLKEQNQQREERTREYGIARQWLLDKIQNCNSQPQRDFTESTLWRLEQQKEEDHRKYVETETLRMAKGRSTCKCELCGRTCHNMWKLMRHKCLEHGMEFRDAEDTTIMRLSWRCGRLSLDGQGCHLHSA